MALTTDQEVLDAICGDTDHTDIDTEMHNTMMFYPDEGIWDVTITLSMKQQACFASLSRINGYIPETFFSLVDCYCIRQLSYKFLLILGACVEVIRLKLYHQTQNTFDADLGELSAPSRVGEVEAMYSKMDEEFERRLEVLKKTNQRFIYGIPSTP